MALTIQNFDLGSKLAVEIAQKLAKEHAHSTFGASHLLMALLNERVGITSFLALMDKDLSYLKGWAQYRMDEYRTKGLPDDSPEADEDARKVLDVARTFQLMFDQGHITPVCILAALTRPGVGFPKGQMGSLRLTEDELVQAVLNDASIINAIGGDNGSPASTSAPSAKHLPENTKAFLTYCIDKIAEAKQGKIDPIFGRDKEIGQMENILCRRTKPNVIITGEPGVGKTALVDGFALKIANGEVSEYFKKAKLFQLDIGALVAGAAYRGEVEDRLKKILTEIKRMDKLILFIDEIHMILDKDGGAKGIANLLKPELARGEINVIGATTNKEYRIYLEKDAAFSRRFEVIRVEEPTVPGAIKMMSGLKNLFEDHHNFKIGDEAVSETAKLAKRYFPQRRLPDSAIDLMDRTMSSFRILEDNLAPRLEKAKAAYAEMPKDSEPKAWEEFWAEAVNTLSPLALETIDVKAPEPQSEAATWTAYIDEVFVELEKEAAKKREQISTDDVGAVVADTTGIPIGKLQGDEQKKLLELENILTSKVIGQDHAAEIISRAIKRSRSGMKEKGKPIGSFFLVGPTGTGKTELAKAITDVLFNDKNNLIRFDMSEYMESHSVSMLKGSPPGYVGYENGGMLVNKLREQPYAVVLFDEIEKAHPDVFKLFLQILDEGHLTDTLDKKASFADTVIIFTSNVESEWVVDQFDKDEMPDEDELKERMMAGRHFKPEFINRLDSVIPFSPLSKEDLVKILDIQLRIFSKLLREQKMTLEVSPEAKTFLVDKGYSPAFGARPIKRVIDSYLGDKISELIIIGDIQKGQHITVGLDGEELTFVAA